MNIKEPEMTIPHHSTPATHRALANQTLLAQKINKYKWMHGARVIYNGTLVGPQGQFWGRHTMEMKKGSPPVEVHGVK